MLCFTAILFGAALSEEAMAFFGRRIERSAERASPNQYRER